MNEQTKGFSGRIEVRGRLMNVVNGVLKSGPKNYYVSDNGEMVVNENRQVVGYVENGMLVPITKEYIEKLRTQGLVE